MPEARFCPECGAARKPPGAAFCGGCGHAYAAAPPAPASQVVPTAASPPPSTQPTIADPLPAAAPATSNFALPNPKSVLGGAAILGGGFLPWWTIPGDSISSWDIPAYFLLTESTTGDGVKVGLLLLVGVLMLLPLLTKKPLPHVVHALVAAVGINSAGLAIVRGLSNDVGIGVGLFVTLAGGALVGFDWFQGRRAVAAPRST